MKFSTIFVALFGLSSAGICYLGYDDRCLTRCDRKLRRCTQNGGAGKVFACTTAREVCGETCTCWKISAKIQINLIFFSFYWIFRQYLNSLAFYKVIVYADTVRSTSILRFLAAMNRVLSDESRNFEHSRIDRSVCTIAKWTTRAILGPAIVFLQNGQKLVSLAGKTWSIVSLVENWGVVVLSKKHIFGFSFWVLIEGFLKLWFDDSCKNGSDFILDVKK